MPEEIKKFGEIAAMGAVQGRSLPSGGSRWPTKPSTPTAGCTCSAPDGACVGAVKAAVRERTKAMKAVTELLDSFAAWRFSPAQPARMCYE